MITWTEFEKREPDLAAAGRERFYQHGLGLGFLATVRRDGGPRVHPVCPVIGDHGLHLVILPGPKLTDLRRDGRYSLHSETLCSETLPPPREDDGFAVTGRVREVADPAARAAIRDQVEAERGQVWAGFDEHMLFELGIERCLLVLTQPGEIFPRGATIWKAPPC
jgi:hypothetical protein